MKHKKFAQDYIKAINENGKAKYIYTGPLYIPENNDKWKIFLLFNWLLAIFNTSTFLIAGLVDTQGFRQMYVVLPYIALVFPLGMLWADAYKLTFSKRPLEKINFVLGFLHLKKMVLFVGVLSLSVVFLHIISIFLKKPASLGKEIITIATMTTMTTLNWTYHSYSKDIKMVEKESPN